MPHLPPAAPPLVAVEALTVPLLVRAAYVLMARYPNATLVKNRAGNLTVMDGKRYAGYVDLTTGEVELWTSPTSPAEPT